MATPTIPGQEPIRATAKLRAALDSCLRAIALARPGPVELHTSCSWRRIMDKDSKPWLWPSVDRDGHPNMDGEAEAEAVVASYNLVSEHRLEIQSMLETALMWEALCDAAERGEDLSGLLHDARHMGAGALELHFAEVVGGIIQGTMYERLNMPSGQDAA